MKKLTALFIFSLFGWLCFISISSSFAQSNFKLHSATRDTTILFVDPSALSPRNRAAVTTAFAKLAINNGAVTPKLINAKDNLNVVLRWRYNIVDSQKHHTANAILNVLTKLNKLDENRTLIEGKSIELPILPVSPSDKSDRDYVQYFDVYNNKSYLSATDSLASFTLSKFNEPVDFDKGKLVAYKLAKDDLEKFKSQLSDTLYNTVYGKSIVAIDTPAFVKITYLEDKNYAETKGIPKINDSILIDKIQKIDISYFNGLYIFDYFNGDNSHGKKVLDVIYSKFKQLGLDTVGYKITPIPINFFQNRKTSINLIEKFYQISNPKKRENNLESLPARALVLSLKSVKADDYGKDDVPEGYLNALFNYYYSLKPDIISTSFTTLTPNSITPQFGKTNTSLLTAVPNDNNFIESETSKIQPPGSLPSFQQPLFTYFNSYPNAGCILVGSRLSPGKFSGWYSKSGNRVTTLGQGTGWGSSFSTIKPEEVGTSFATPDVASQLYIAKAYWRSQNLLVDAQEARIRLLLATDLDSSFVGKFASGGLLNMNKLMQVSYGFAETLDGETVPITYIPGIIDYANGDRRMPFNRYGVVTELKDSEPTICGLTAVGGVFYAFFEKELVWKKIEIDAIKLTLIANNIDYPIRNLKDFTDRFKQIILLKNL